MNAVTAAEPVAEIGHNQPPEPTPYEAHKANMDDLLMEARNWADGVAVENQKQADEISRLIEDLRLAEAAADAARVVEKKPHDDAANEVQERYNAYIAPLKNKKPGKVPVAMDALKATLKPYLDKVDAELKAAADKARKDAEDKAAAATAALRAADLDNLESREAANALVEAARLATKAATAAGNVKAQAKGGSRAMGLSKTYTAEITDRKAALLHYAVAQHEALMGFILTLAQQDVDQGKRTIPGVFVREGTKL